MKEIIKNLLPRPLLDLYYKSIALLAALYYRTPSREMVVIGVTGTKGKTTIAYFLWSALNAAGCKTGLIGTAAIGIGTTSRLNPFHMTMPGRFALQRFLREMAAEGCMAAVVETTSQGIAQFRHFGVIYDIAIFTNLTPEHIESHGSFEQYRAEKQKLFEKLASSERKTIHGAAIPKAIIACADSKEAKHFLIFPADRTVTYGVSANAHVRAAHIEDSIHGVSFTAEGKRVKLTIPGSFNAVNALPAFIVGDLLGLPARAITAGLEQVASIPGRMEIISRKPFLVIVDYAHEPVSMETVFSNVRPLIGAEKRIIAIFGATGGGRDKAKRPKMGMVAGKRADIIILTTDDPYDENPLEIIDQIAGGVYEAEKREGRIMFKIPNRRLAIRKAISLAKPGDAILILGMGAEQSFIAKGEMVPWDDRKVTREELSKYMK